MSFISDNIFSICRWVRKLKLKRELAAVWPEFD